MKKLFGFALAVIFALSLGVTVTLYSQTDGCYLCEGGGYVKFKGADTFDKRKKAKEQFGCKVSGTTGSCSNPKGTVE
jgi:hypothetical protein